MNVYFEVWQRAREMPPVKRREWILKLYPAKGVTVEFEGIQAIDIDVLEALEYMDSIARGHVDIT